MAHIRTKLASRGRWRSEVAQVVRRVVMLLTRTVRGIPTEVPLDVDDEVSEPCAAWLDNVELMPKAYLVERMCTVGPQQMAAVCAALAIAVDCQR